MLHVPLVRDPGLTSTIYLTFFLFLSFLYLLFLSFSLPVCDPVLGDEGEMVREE